MNATGSFALGLVTGLGSGLPEPWVAILGVGLLGGYTTFSTVAVESVVLARDRRRDWAWVNLLGTFGVCIVTASIGLVLGSLIPH